jgi:predicted nucleic acid-binding protein
METRMKVYCEHHALRQWLKDLQKESRIILVLFPYDQRAKRIKEVATPSEATWEELNIPWNKLDFSWEEFSPSSRYSEICNIIGEANIRDAKHVDSAFKSKCQCIFTCDRDILSHSQELEKLLNIKFFHPDNHKEEFMAFLKRYEENENP